MGSERESVKEIQRQRERENERQRERAREWVCAGQERESVLASRRPGRTTVFIEQVSDQLAQHKAEISPRFQKLSVNSVNSYQEFP